LTPQPQGPAKGVLDIGQRIIGTLVNVVETRVRLAVVELEEEKNNVIQLLMMTGLTLLFTAFGLMSLLVLLFLAIDPAHRLIAVGITTAVLLLLAVIGLFWTLAKAKRSSLLKSTREQLAIDRDNLDQQP